MNVEYFKAEFLNFLPRFVAPANDQNVIPILTPLTYQEILTATTDVINLQLNAVLADLSQEVKTPSAGIMVITPDAPDIPKMNNEHGENGGNLARFRSLDKPALDDFKDSPNEQMRLAEASPLPAKIDCGLAVDGVDNNFPNDKKKEAVSKLSPPLVRSDTYVRENNSENASKGDGFGGNALPQFPMNGFGTDDFSISNLNVPEFRKKLDILRDVAKEVVKKIDDLEMVVPENTRPIRRLSTIGCFPGSNRNSVAARTIQRPKMGRRSLTTFPGTPTSSRMSPDARKADLSSTKSVSTVALVSVNNSRLAIPSTIRSVSSGALKIEKKGSPSSAQGSRLPTAKTMKPIPSTLRSVSSGALKLAKKSFKTPNQGPRLSEARELRSPALSLMNSSNEVQERPLKNPKYAHVASTIPKAGSVLGKRKADQF